MLKQYLTQFFTNIEMLRDYADFSEKNLLKYLIENVKGMAPALTELQKSIKETPSEAGSKIETLLVQINQIFGEDPKLNQANGLSNLNILETALKIKEKISHLERKSLQRTHVYNSTLVSLISTIEHFTLTLLHHYYDKYPDSILGSEKSQLSFRELKDFDSIQDAAKYLIERHVENLLRGNFSDWITYFRKEIKLPIERIDCHLKHLEEIYQTRNHFST